MLSPGDYLAWVRSLPCLKCGDRAEAHHWAPTRALGKKVSHYRAVPLCTAHHREFHDTGSIRPFDAAATRSWFLQAQADQLIRRIDEG